MLCGTQNSSIQLFLRTTQEFLQFSRMRCRGGLSSVSSGGGLTSDLTARRPHASWLGPSLICICHNLCPCSPFDNPPANEIFACSGVRESFDAFPALERAYTTQEHAGRGNDATNGYASGVSGADPEGPSVHHRLNVGREAVEHQLASANCWQFSRQVTSEGLHQVSADAEMGNSMTAVGSPFGCLVRHPDESVRSQGNDGKSVTGA